MADRRELEDELDKGALPELPPNIPPGFLGEVGPDLRKVDEFKPSLNAGIIQEGTARTRFLTIVLLYLLVITSPIAVFMLWRTRRLRLWVKIVVTLAMVAGLVALFSFVRF